MHHRPLIALGLLATLTLPVAACGGDDSDSTTATTAAGNTVRVEAQDSLKFDADSYEASAGSVNFDYVNDGGIPHTLVIEDASGNEVPDFKLSIGDEDTGTADLEAGTYTIFCDIPGHRGAGMEATLTIG
jgi:uncharacterized cupredoxin-like copper-binding protein